jgi:hypothetical protein
VIGWGSTGVHFPGSQYVTAKPPLLPPVPPLPVVVVLVVEVVELPAVPELVEPVLPPLPPVVAPGLLSLHPNPTTPLARTAQSPNTR